MSNKAKLKNHMINIDKYGKAAIITLYHNSKLILQRIIPDHNIITHVINVYKIFKKITCLKWMYGLFGQDYRVATLSTFYLSVFRNHHTKLEIDKRIITYLN